MYIGLLQIDTQTDTNTHISTLQLKEIAYVKIKRKIFIDIYLIHNKKKQE